MSVEVMNLGTTLSATARRLPEHVGLVHGAGRWSFAELEANADALARGLLALGVRPGDRVLVQCLNSRWMFEAQYAVMRTGAVYVPVNARATARETAQIAGLSRAPAMIADAAFAERAAAAVAASPALRHVITTAPVAVPAGGQPAAWLVHDALLAQHRTGAHVNHPVNAGDACLQLYTAGTTGVPKGAVHSHASYAFALLGRVADVLPGLDHDSALLAIGPLSHGTGTLASCAVMKGARTVLPAAGRFDAGECWRLVEDERISTTFTVPTMLMDLARHADARRRDRSSLRHVVYAGAPITRADQRLAMELLGPVLVQYYGAAENMGTATVLYPHMHGPDDADPMTPVGSCGVARSGVEVAIKDDDMHDLPPGEVGQIWVRTAANMLGYHDLPAASAQALVDGWLSVGDLARMDERGFVYIVGRTREMYKSGGLQVYPNETQDHLAAHPAVAEAHVVSVPDSRWGETGVALVMLGQGAQASEAELRAFLRERLAGYKLPRRIFIVDALPRSAYGKVSKDLLREELLRRALITPGEDVPAAGTLEQRA
jgi:acyl-CoA synthetase (AMP-forming)/AMP-acid ligase II